MPGTNRSRKSIRTGVQVLSSKARPKSVRRAPGGVAIACVLAAGITTAAGYPPGGYPGPAPENAFPTVAVSQTVDAHGGEVSATEGGIGIRVEVPPGSFLEPTQVTVYVGATSVVGPVVPPGDHLLLAYAIAWTPVVDAAHSLTLSLSDAAISAGAHVYTTTGTGVTPAPDATVRTGSVTLGFSSEMAIVVAEAGGSSTQPRVSPPSTRGSSEGGGPPTLVLALVALAVVLVAGSVVAWRRSRGREGGR